MRYLLILVLIYFSFLVGGDGTVYEGRGWGIVGAHAKENNHDSVGIALLGNFNSKKNTNYSKI